MLKSVRHHPYAQPLEAMYFDLDQAVDQLIAYAHFASLVKYRRFLPIDRLHKKFLSLERIGRRPTALNILTQPHRQKITRLQCRVVLGPMRHALPPLHLLLFTHEPTLSDVALCATKP